MKLEVILKCAALACLIVLLVIASFAANEARIVLESADTNLQELRIATAELLNATGATIDNLNKTIISLNEATGAQTAYWNKSEAEAYKTLAAARQVIVLTDHSLNDILVPQLAKSLADTSDLSKTAAQDLTNVTNGVAPILTNLGNASAAAATEMSNPQITEAVAHLDATSAQLEQTAKNATETMAHVDSIADRADQRFKEITKPASLAMRIFSGTLEYAWKAADITAGFFK